jgi:hypothetical protein
MSQYRLMRHLLAIATVGAFASVGCFSADDEDDGDDGGGAGESGGGTGGSGSGRAVLKFCSELFKGDQVAPLTLTFSGVEVTTDSGTCTPVVPDACIRIPTGEDPLVTLTDAETGYVVAQGQIPMTVASGDEILALASVDDLNYPTVLAGTFDEIWGEDVACADTDPFETAPQQAMSVSFGTRPDLRISPSLPRWTRKAASVAKPAP